VGIIFSGCFIEYEITGQSHNHQLPFLGNNAIVLSSNWRAIAKIKFRLTIAR